MKLRYSGCREPLPKIPEAWNKDKESRRLWRATQRAVHNCMKRHITDADKKRRGIEGSRHV